MNHQRLVLGQRPVRVVVENIRIAAHRLAECLVGGGQLIAVRQVALAPVGEQPGGVLDETCDPRQALLEGRRVKGLWLGIGADSLDAQLGRHFAAPVKKGLAHDQGVGRAFHFQPVARLRFAAEDDVEIALVIDL
ncbi:hypothetical protein D3C76_1460980 [compost metagenome]